MQMSDKQLSAEQSRQVAATIREELARRRISRQHLAEQAKLSISTLEKALGGRRPFTLATTVRLEQALGVSLRKGADGRRSRCRPMAMSRPTASAPIRAARSSWIEGTYLTLRPVVRRKGFDLRLPHRNHLGRGGVMPACFARPSGSMRPSPSSARSRCRTSPDISISSPTATVSTGSSRCRGRPSRARCTASSRRCSRAAARC